MYKLADKIEEHKDEFAALEALVRAPTAPPWLDQIMALKEARLGHALHAKLNLTQSFGWKLVLST